MILQPAGLEALEVDALQTDRYLDALLSAVDRRTDDVPANPAIDPALRLAARRLRDELVRTHPSFRFEERLAGRLADAAARMRPATAARGEVEAAIIPFPVPLRADPVLAAEMANPEPAALLGARYAAEGSATAASMPPSSAPAASAVAPARAPVTAPAPLGAGAIGATNSPFRPVVARPLLVRGALTSAVLSLAGAAFVAWRLTRGAPTDPMAHATRAARAVRFARAALAAGDAAVTTATQATAATTAAATAVDATLGHRGLA